MKWCAMKNPPDLFYLLPNFVPKESSGIWNRDSRQICCTWTCRQALKLNGVEVVLGWNHTTLAMEFDISLNAVGFQDNRTDRTSKSVVDLFCNESEGEIQKYLFLCKKADAFKNEKGDWAENWTSASLSSYYNLFCWLFAEQSKVADSL